MKRRRFALYISFPDSIIYKYYNKNFLTIDMINDIIL